MNRKQESRNELRAAFASRQLKKGKLTFPPNNTGIFMQVTLAILYMYLILISYNWMGISGAVVVSCTFLVALFLPVLVRLVMDHRVKKKARNEVANTTLKTEVERQV